jgi:DNA-directed RNA polymerase subunit E'/Rpb7
MSNPYYRVTVKTRVRVHPEGLNNNIDENIKDEILANYDGRCYKDYGYVDGIYKISEAGSRGVIQREDPTASALYDVNMECRMLVPIPQQTIYSKITGINEKMIVAETGQLKIMIYENSINKNNIKYIKSAYYPVNSEGRPIGDPIREGTPVIVRLLACRIVPNKKNLMGLGMLESIVAPKDYDKIDLYQDEEEFTMEDIEALRGRAIDTDNGSELSVTEKDRIDNGPNDGPNRKPKLKPDKLSSSIKKQSDKDDDRLSTSDGTIDSDSVTE